MVIKDRLDAASTRLRDAEEEINLKCIASFFEDREASTSIIASLRLGFDPTRGAGVVTRGA